MTVYELIEELKKFPQLDQVQLIFGVTRMPVERVYHDSTYGEHAVIID